MKSAGYEVIAARSGKEAIEIFRTEAIDAVVADFFMPQMNGRTLAEALKSAKRNVPIIMYTGARPILDEMMGRVDIWLVKGESNPEDLLSALSKLLRNSG